MKPLIEALLAGSDRQLDERMKPLIRAWDDPPKAAQVLQVLDLCIHGALASGFVVKVLEILYDEARRRESATHGDVAAHASWRRT